AWSNAAPALAATAATSLLVGVLATAAALTLTLAALQAEYRMATPPIPPLLFYLPLIVPQICFLPGLEAAALPLGATGGLASVTAAHLLFVLPYTYLTLSGPSRAWDSRIAKVAATLGASTSGIFWRLRLPMLLAPILTAAAVGLAVSIAQYLPTLLVGGGRVTTLTTEALALASGGNRRLTSAYALLQALLPIAGFLIAAGLPRWLHRRRFAAGFA
ncbi:MAG: ABC transporter permease subunit, partial [Pseudorhodobacter sp.]|nr:ABC transporter permease subunit [Pseudorhodobacter sp.]